MTEKLLSIVIVGRNDDYLGNYIYRLQTCLNFLAQNLKTLGRLDDVEVLLVDWNSPGDETLADALTISPEAAEIVRAVIVPSEVAAARNPLLSFFTTCAVNVGVRRARGEFIMLADSDSMTPLPALKSLLEVLSGDHPLPWPRNEIIFPIPRHQIPGGVGARKPSVEEWGKLLIRNFGSRRKESPGADCLGGYSAAQLLHRDIWWEFGGYNEQLDRAWGWSDNELMLRVSRKYNWVDLGYYGVAAFHIEHHAVSVSTHQRDPDSINIMMLSDDDHPSPEDWGLANADLEEKLIEPTAHWRAPTPYNSPMGYELVNLPALDKARTSDQFTPYLYELQCRYNAGAEFEPWKSDAAAAIVTIANIESPLSVWCFGPLEDALVDAALDSAPGAEIFFAASWAAGDLTGAPMGPDRLTSHLNFSSHRAYARAIVGLPTEAIDRVRKSDPHAKKIELAIIDRVGLDRDFEAVFGRVLGELASGGAIVLIDKSERGPKSSSEDALTDRLQRLTGSNANACLPGDVFVGRSLADYARRMRSEDPKQRPPFSQSAGEIEAGRHFDVLAMPSGAVHVIRKRPAVAASQPSMPLAAE